MEIKEAQVFVPLPKQTSFLYNLLHNDEAKFVWYCGGFGSGKSFIGSHAAVRLAMSAPGGRGLIARNTLVDLKATTMKTFFEVIDPRLIYKWNKTENLLTLINGHEIYFWGLDDIEKLKSLEIGWFWFDEVDEVKPIVFDVAVGRLRNKRQPKRVGMITSNSEGKNWTYKKFIRGVGVRTQKDLDKYYVIKAPSTENTHLPEDYIETLNSYTGDLFDRYVNASFDVFEGQVFKEFRRDIHVIPAFGIPKDWKKVRGIDHGERNPTAVLSAAVSPEGDIYIFREHYEAGQSVDWHAEQVAEKSEGEYYEYNVCDPSLKSVRGVTGKKVDREWKEAMQEYEPEFKLKYGVNSVNAGIARMHRYLAIDPERKHPITGKMGAPKLYIFDTCPITADELESYKWAKPSSTSEDDPQEKVRKKDDHTTDVVRYILMSRPDKESGTVFTKRNNNGLMAMKPSKRDQVLPTSDEAILENLRKQNPNDFLI